MIWFNESREDIKTDNPGISFIEIAKKGGELWKKMSTSEKSVTHKMHYYMTHNTFISYNFIV